MDELKKREVKKMDEVDAYQQEEQNRKYYGSLILGDKSMHNPQKESDVDLAKAHFDKYDSRLKGMEIDEHRDAKKEIADRKKSQKKLIKDNESDKVDLMVLTNQNPYLMAEWLRASAVAHDSSKSFTAVVVAMDYLLSCKSEEVGEAAMWLKKAVSSYLSSHKKSPLTISGRQRVKMCRGILERVDLFPSIINWQRKYKEEKDNKNGTDALINGINDSKASYESGLNEAKKRQKVDDLGLNAKQRNAFVNVLKPESKEEKDNAAWNDSFVKTSLELKNAKDEKAIDNAKKERIKILDSLSNELTSFSKAEADMIMTDPDYFAMNYIRLERLLRIAEFFKNVNEDKNSPDAFYFEVNDQNSYLAEIAADKAAFIQGIISYNNMTMNISKQYFEKGKMQDISNNANAITRLKELRENAYDKKNYQRRIENNKIPAHLTKEFYEHFGHLGKPEMKSEKIVDDAKQITKKIDKIITGFVWNTKLDMGLPNIKEAKRIEKSGSLEEKYTYLIIFSQLEHVIDVAKKIPYRIKAEYREIFENIKGYFGEEKASVEKSAKPKKGASDKEKYEFMKIAWAHEFMCRQKLAARFYDEMSGLPANATKIQQLEAEKEVLSSIFYRRDLYNLWRCPYEVLKDDMKEVTSGVAELDKMIKEVDGMEAIYKPAENAYNMILNDYNEATKDYRFHDREQEVTQLICKDNTELGIMEVVYFGEIRK